MIDQTPPTPEQLAQARESALAAQHPDSWVWDEDAVSFCLIGAKEKAIWDNEADKDIDIDVQDSRDRYRISKRLSNVFRIELASPAVEFNDDPDTEHANVLAFIDASIAYFSSHTDNNKGQ
jgi:hypothetical protein